MGQILHGCAKTTQAVRKSIQESQESIAKLSERYSINVKTVVKWKKRTFTKDLPMGPKDRKSTVLSQEEEAIIVAFRKHTLLPLDDCLYVLQETIPHLSRSSLHRCLQRHRISRLPQTNENDQPKKKFKKYPIGYFHVDIAQVSTQEGKLYLFVAIDRSSKFTYVELHKCATKVLAAEFLNRLQEAVPYKIRTILTDNGIQFTHQGRHNKAFEHIFGRVCRENKTYAIVCIRKYYYCN